MSRQSGLGRGLGALLPPQSLYETPKMEKIRESKDDEEAKMETSNLINDEIELNTVKNQSTTVQNATNSAIVDSGKVPQSFDTNEQEARVTNLVSRLLLISQVTSLEYR